MSKKSIKIKTDHVMLWPIMFYLFTIVFFDGTIIFKGATMILYAVGLLYLLTRTSGLRVNPFIAFMLMFVVYNALNIYLGNVISVSTASSRLETVALNFLSNSIILMICVDKKNRIRIAKAYINIAVLFFFYVLLSDGTNVLQSRFGATSLPFGLSGTNGLMYNTNFVGRSFYSGLVMGHIYYLSRKEQLAYGEINGVTFKHERTAFISKSVILFIGIFLSGSRSALLVILIYALLFGVIISKNAGKTIKYAMAAIILAIVAYAVMMYIPAVYNVIGVRYEVLLNGLLSDEVEAGTSFYYRNSMALLGLQWFAERPVFGYGLDAYSLLSSYETYSHNNFVEILVSSGIIGFLLYYGAIAALLIRANKKRKMDDSRNEGSAVIAFIIANLIMNVSHVDYVDRNTLMCMYMFAAFAFERSGFRKYGFSKMKG